MVGAGLLALLSALQVSCDTESRAPQGSVELEDGQVATWPLWSDDPLLELDVNSILGLVRVFGDGRVAVHDAFARRRERDAEMRLSSAELDELVRCVVGSGVLWDEGAEAPYQERSTHPSTWRLRVRLGTVRDGRGEVTHGFERSFAATDILLSARHLEGGDPCSRHGLAAVMARVYELSRSPKLRTVAAEAPAQSRPDWARGVEGRTPRVVYRVSQGRGPTTLRTVDWLGKDEGLLVSIRAPDLALSPDGSSVAYLGEGGLTVRSLATGEDRILVPGVDRAHSLLWSPDGEDLAFSAEIGERYYHLFVAATDGSGWEPLTDSGARPLAWSPDGRSIYYEQHRRGIQQLGAHSVSRPNVFVTGREGFGAVPVVPWLVGGFSLSPDGRRASYGSGDYTSHSPERAKARLLWVVRLDPGTGGRLAAHVGMAVGEGSGAQWSVDGRSLLYSRGRSIEVVRTDGRGRTILREEKLGNRSLTNLRWSPDARAILFVRKPIASGQRLGGMPDIWVMGSDGSEPRYLAEGVWAEWMPESNRRPPTARGTPLP